MNDKFYLWQEFMQVRDQTILALFGLALIMTLNWLMWRDRKPLACLMLAGGLVTCVILILIVR